MIPRNTFDRICDRVRIMDILYPLFFKPIYKDYLWGGRRIPHYFNRKTAPGIYAESWELSDREEGRSIITHGPLQGISLSNLLKEKREDVLGEQAHLSHFPLLAKLIDANENLSVQVHPDEQTAKEQGGEAKTEAWYIVEAEKGAAIYAGFKKAWNLEEIKRKLPTKEIIDLMHKIPVKREDVIYIPGGRLHAIGKGCLLFEIQQNSNTTYRVYDWDRPRLLHLKEASQVMNLSDTAHPLVQAKIIEKRKVYSRRELLTCPHFSMEKWELYESLEWEQRQGRCEILFFLSGTGELCSSFPKTVHPGMTCLLPAHSEKVNIVSREAPLTFLCISPLG
jgi:mannose-6-phosphate isomerase